MEDFVTFEQAIKFKELGFDWKCYTFYHGDNWCGLSHSGMCENHNMFEKCVSAPTLSQAQKWMREVKNIHLEIKYMSNPQYEPWVGKVVIIENYPKPNTIIDIDTCDTYEEALSICIDKALEILKQEKK